MMPVKELFERTGDTALAVGALKKNSKFLFLIINLQKIYAYILFMKNSLKYISICFIFCYAEIRLVINIINDNYIFLRLPYACLQMTVKGLRSVF